MAMVKFDAVVLNVAADPSDYLVLRFVSGFSRKPERPGRVQRLAGGRKRVIRQAGTDTEWSLSFKAVTPEQKAWLEGHIGQVVCARDDRGHKVFGVYLSVPTEEHRYNHEADVSLELTEVTFSEAV